MGEIGRRRPLHVVTTTGRVSLGLSGSLLEAPPARQAQLPPVSADGVDAQGRCSSTLALENPRLSPRSNCLVQLRHTAVPTGNANRRGILRFQKHVVPENFRPASGSGEAGMSNALRLLAARAAQRVGPLSAPFWSNSVPHSPLAAMVQTAARVQCPSQRRDARWVRARQVLSAPRPFLGMGSGCGVGPWQGTGLATSAAAYGTRSAASKAGSGGGMVAEFNQARLPPQTSLMRLSGRIKLVRPCSCPLQS